MKRVKLKLTRPNALFESWLEEWMKEAASRKSELRHHFARALASLKKYPLPLESGRDCIILQHFGTRLCSMLDRKLKEHLRDARLRGDFVCKCSYQEERVLCGKEDAQQGSGAGQEAGKPEMEMVLKAIGIASWSLENYSALFALYLMSKELLYQGFVLETVVLSRMQELYEVRSKIPLYSLFSDGLVSMTGSPVRYTLTDQGTSVAKSICDTLAIDVTLITSIEKVKEIQGKLTARFSERVAVLTSERVALKSKSPKKAETRAAGESAANKRKKANTEKAAGKSRTVEDENNAVDDIRVEINLEPFKFDIVLLVDTHETCGAKTKPQHDATIFELTQLNVLFEVRHLKVGDFAWIARCRQTRKELVLPYVVERKRIDDLSASIVDGRFHEQKFRLKQSGIPNIMYVVECYDKTQRLTVPHSALMQASINSMVQDGFTLKYTKSHKDTMSHLACITKVLIREYKGKNLIGCKKEDLGVNNSETSVPLMVFDEFNKAAAKQKVFKVSEMFVRQLLQLKGLSVDKALAIVEKYPTPQALMEALVRSGTGGEQMLANIKVTDRKRAINATLSKAVFELYTRKSLG